MAAHTHDHAHDDHAHGAHGAHGHVGYDRRPAFLGLIIGGIALGAILYGTVLWTNTRFEGHSAAPAAAGAKPAAGGAPAAH